jgi:antitoxin component YwqK of YwqJK toxin-antitoxin module
MKKLLLILYVTGICFGQTHDQIEEFYDNGLPKLVKKYKVLNGESVIFHEINWYANGQKSKESRANNYGKIDGKYSNTWWHENGQMKEKSFFKDNKRTGIATNWYENGKKESRGTFKDGERNGLTTFWFDNGKRNIVVAYKDGKSEGLSTHWHRNGKKSFLGRYKDGLETGNFIWWYSNGKKFKKSFFIHGKRDGKDTVWYKNGQKLKEVTYKDGKEISALCWDEDGNDKECI